MTPTKGDTGVCKSLFGLFSLCKISLLFSAKIKLKVFPDFDFLFFFIFTQHFLHTVLNDLDPLQK